jgi:hypothetical protein
MAMARLGCVDGPRTPRRRDDCKRERRADLQVSRIVGDPRVTLLIVDHAKDHGRVARYLRGDVAGHGAQGLLGQSLTSS